MKHVRTFAAVNLSVASVRAMAKLQQTLHEAIKALHPARLRWVPPPNIHVTVKFYGNLFEDQLPAVVDAAREAARGVRPFALVARGLGAFPSAERPRVIWVGLRDGADALSELRERLEEASWALGFEREERPFHPHVTLGRVSGGKVDLSELVAEHAEADGLVSTVEELVIYESRLSRRSAEYVARARVPLQGTSAFRRAAETPTAPPSEGQDQILSDRPAAPSSPAQSGASPSQ